MADEKIKVRIKPLHNIGGVGTAGAVVWMSREDAEMYFHDGYVEYVEAEEAEAPEAPEAPEDHRIMKPQSRRKK